jgi:hypothetical protein
MGRTSGTVSTAAAGGLFLLLGGFVGYSVGSGAGDLYGAQPGAFGAPKISPGESPGAGGSPGPADKVTPPRPQHGAELARLVRELAALEKAQSHDLDRDQAAHLVPVLSSLRTASHLSDEEAGKNLSDINSVLTDKQRELMADLDLRRSSGAAAGSPARTTVGAGSQRTRQTSRKPPGPVQPGGGSPVNADKPFASGASREALEYLVDRAGKGGRVGIPR